MNTSRIFEYLNTHSPSGYESPAQKVWAKMVSNPNVIISHDTYGNCFAEYTNVIKPEGSDTSTLKTLVIDAHADEIGFLVKDIVAGGYIKISRLGGSDISITPSSKVKIWTFNNPEEPITGVFGHPAIHVQKDTFKAKGDEIFVDVGCKSEKEVRALGIEIGNPITMDRDAFMLGDYYTGKSLDDKMGGVVTATVLNHLVEHNVKLPYRLVMINSVQEEVGLRGAQIATKTIGYDIDLAIAIDVCHCTDSPAYSRSQSGNTKSGKGPVIMTAPSLHKTVTRNLIKVADTNNIPLQFTTSGSSSGTNADSYAYQAGIPTALTKLALKYMHTTVEMVHRDDVHNLVEWLIAYLKSNPLDDSFIGNSLVG